MSYMDLVTAISNEIKGTADFFTSRRNVMGLAADNSNEIADQLAENIILQINRLPPIKVDGGKVLNDAVGNSGHSAEGMKKIMDCIAKKLIEPPGKKNATFLGWTKLREGMQFYISKNEVDGLNCHKKPLANKIQLIVDRLCKLGIMKPDEHTFACAVAILVLCHFQIFPKYKQVFAILGDMKSCHSATKHEWPFDYIQDYPMHPDQLPLKVLNHAYDKDDPPEGIEIDRLKLVAENHVPLRKSSKLLTNEEDNENKLRESMAGTIHNGGQLIPHLLKGISSYFTTVEGAHLTVEPPRSNPKAFADLKPASLRSSKWSTIPLEDGPLVTIDGAKGHDAASHELDASTQLVQSKPPGQGLCAQAAPQQSNPPEEGKGAIAADTQKPPAGLGASLDGLNMETTEPDPKKQKLNEGAPELTEFEQKMAAAFKTRDADKAEERRKNKKEEKNKKKEIEERYKQTLKLLRTLKMKIEAASSMHQASYPAMPCKHQHVRVKPSKEKMVEFVNYMNSL